MVDPTGLEPAPHGLKVRYSATRVPGQQEKFLVSSLEFRVVLPSELETRNSELETIDLAVAEGFEPSRGRSNNPVPYQLGYATMNWLREQELNLPVLAYETSEPPLLYSRVMLEAMKGVEPLSTGLQDRRSVIQLSYIAIN